MNSRQFKSRDFLAVVGRYVLAVLFVIVAAAIARLINPPIGETTASLFFAAVILSAWTGGLGPGLTTTALAAYIAGTFYQLNPSGSPGFGLDDWLQAFVFVSVAVLISWLTARRRRAEAALQKSYDQLEVRIGERTAELSQSNTLLRESEERFRLLVDGVADYAIVMLDAMGTVMSWNPGATRIFGYAHEDAIGAGLRRFIHRRIRRAGSRRRTCWMPLSLAVAKVRGGACGRIPRGSGRTSSRLPFGTNPANFEALRR